MLASNHAATGAIIALKITNPVVALPLAFASHFVLDCLPHFGFGRRGFDYAIKQKLMYLAVSLDAIGGLILLWLLWGSSPLVFACGAAAVAPDIYNIHRVFVTQKGKELPLERLNIFSKFHSIIQWGQFRYGLLIEIAFFISVAILITKLV